VSLVLPAPRPSRASCSAQPRELLPIFRATGVSHMMAGRAEHARQCVEEVRRLDPALRMSNLAELLPLRRSQDFVRWADALHTAGLPD
jgi:hypothetical protein